MSEKKKNKQIANTAAATNQDLFLRMVWFHNTTEALIRERDELELYSKQDIVLSDEQYQELVASFTLDDVDEVPPKEDLEVYLNEKKDNTKVNNKIIEVNREIKDRQNKFKKMWNEVKENNTDVYEALQEITNAKLKELWEI